MKKRNHYDHEFKVQAVKLALEVGQTKACTELNLPENTIYGWMHAYRQGKLEAWPRHANTIPSTDDGRRTKTVASASQRAGQGNQASKRRKRLSGGSQRFFRRMPSEVSKDVRMAFIAKKTCDGTEHGKLAFYCRMLKVSRQGFYEYLKAKDKPWKYEKLANLIMTIRDEDICNDSYGRVKVHQALKLKAPTDTTIPSERTVYRVMKELGIVQPKRRKPNGLTKAERNARKSDDLLKRDFTATQPATKCVTDITEFKFSDGKLYVSA